MKTEEHQDELYEHKMHFLYSELTLYKSCSYTYGSIGIRGEMESSPVQLVGVGLQQF